MNLQKDLPIQPSHLHNHLSLSKFTFMTENEKTDNFSYKIVFWSLNNKTPIWIRNFCFNLWNLIISVARKLKRFWYFFLYKQNNCDWAKQWLRPTFGFESSISFLSVAICLDRISFFLFSSFNFWLMVFEWKIFVQKSYFSWKVILLL